MRAACILALGSILLAQPADLADKARRAAEMVRSGKPEGAIPIYRELATRFPNDVNLLVNLAIAEFQAKRYRDSADHSAAARRLAPDLPAANLFSGASLFELGEYSSAVEPLERVVQAQPRDRNARLLLAESFLELHRYREAAEHFRTASELAAGNPAVWYGLGRSLAGLSEQSLQELAATAPQSAYWNAAAAAAALEKRRYGEAFRHYRQALAIDPNLPGLRSGLSRLYREAGRVEEAVKQDSLERQTPAWACESHPLACEFAAGRFPQLTREAGSSRAPEALYWTHKAFQEMSRQAYDRLAQLPPSAESHMRAASLLEARTLYPDAAAEWREALRLSPGNQRVQIALAWCSYRAGDYQNAFPLIEQLLKANPRSPVITFLYGATLLSLHRPDQALPYLKSSVSTDPSFLPAEAALGQALLSAGRPEEAIPHLRNSLAGDEDGSRHFQLLRAYQLTGKPELAAKAIAEYRAILHSLEEKRRAEEQFSGLQ